MLSNRKDCTVKSRRRRTSLVESLEQRLFFAAHDVTTGMTFATIQAAVSASNPGDTIAVDAGTYNELVTVNKTLTLQGAKAGVDGKDPSRGSGETIIRGLQIAAGVQSTALDITANNVTVDGFTFQDNTSSGNLGAGVVFAPSISGTHFFNNIVKNNITGLFLANANPAQPALIEHNLFDSNNNPGNNNGRGIYSDGGVSGGLLSGVTIDSNTFTNNVGDGSAAPNAQAAIGLEAQTAGKQFNITISNNVMQNNGKGMLLINTTNVTITHNVITGSTDAVSAAIRLEGGNNNITIQCNTIAQNTGTAVELSPRFTGPDANVTVNMNNIVGNAKGGVIVDAGGYASGVLDATSNYWGAANGPSGDFAGSGDSAIGNGTTILVNPILSAPSDCAPAFNQSPRDLLLGVINDVTTVRNATSGDAGNKLGDMLKKLLEANDNKRWLDKNDLAKGGQDVFDRLKDVYHQMGDLQKDKKNAVSVAFLQNVQARLLTIAQTLADMAIFNASSGDPKKLAEAQQELNRAQNSLSNNKIDETFDHLKNAWQKSMEALHLN